MKCPRCRQRPLSPFAFLGNHLGPMWKDRGFACRRCGAKLRPAGVFARHGFNPVGMACGLIAAGLAVPWLGLVGGARAFTFVAVALGVAWTVDYRVVGYELEPGEDPSVLPQSSVVRRDD